MTGLRVLAALGLVGCAGSPPLPPAEAAPHLGDAWFVHRAAELELSVEAARARDAQLSETEPPEALDASTRREASLLWRDLCAGCHGPRGRLQGVEPSEVAPRSWGGMGAAMGFFFGGDRMRAGIYRKIADGVENPSSPMPAWRATLAREQMWALVAHIESL